MDKKPLHLIGALATIAVMWGAVFWMIEGRASILREGQEIVLKTRPIDPRDFLRGRYVRLGYDITRVEITKRDDLFGEDSQFDHYGAPIFVVLKKVEDGRHGVDSYSLVKPDDGLFIEGKIRNETTSASGEAGGVMIVEYGIERFYASETVAPDLEKRMRDGEITDVIVAVNAVGKAQIKALKQGERIFLTEEFY